MKRIIKLFALKVKFKPKSTHKPTTKDNPMQSLAQLESKILDLQNQIQATQAQITDYQKFNVLYRICEVCKYKEKYVSGSGIVICPICKSENIKFTNKNTYSIGIGIISENPKKQELNKAQAQLATLQNELKTTQSQYEQEKEQYKTRAMILNQAFVSTPPPSKNLSSQKVFKSIESLQGFLKKLI